MTIKQIRILCSVPLLIAVASCGGDEPATYDANTVGDVEDSIEAETDGSTTADVSDVDDTTLADADAFSDFDDEREADTDAVGEIDADVSTPPDTSDTADLDVTNEPDEGDTSLDADSIDSEELAAMADAVYDHCAESWGVWCDMLETGECEGPTWENFAHVASIMQEALEVDTCHAAFAATQCTPRRTSVMRGWIGFDETAAEACYNTLVAQACDTTPIPVCADAMIAQNAPGEPCFAAADCSTSLGNGICQGGYHPPYPPESDDDVREGTCLELSEIGQTCFEQEDCREGLYCELEDGPVSCREPA